MSEPLREMTAEELAVVAGMCQWQRSLKRPDLRERDRVRGAIDAALRQMFACELIAATPLNKEEGAEP